MTATLSSIAGLCPDLPPNTVEQHLKRLDEEYLRRFDEHQIAEHLRSLAKLSADHPVEVILAHEGGAAVTCVIVAFDHAYEFSLITGVLAGTGFRIEGGDVFTLRPPAAEQAPARRTLDRRAWAHRMRRSRMKPAAPRDPMKRAVIVDTFRGEYDASQPFDAWAERLRGRLSEVIGLLDRGDPESVEKAKRRVNQLVTASLSTNQSARTTALKPVDLQLTPNVNGRTRLSIVAEDTPAFLYSLSTALSLQGLTIERVRITGEQSRVADEIDVVDADGQPISDPAQLERIRLSAMLTKQFTFFLDQAADTFTALSRYEQLTEQLAASPQQRQWVQLLSDPRAMMNLAQLLGASDYLWQDFIRQRIETLLPLLREEHMGRGFGQPDETMPLRLERALEGAVGLEEQRDRLNRFKDQEIFEIDLDHILTPEVDFREFSRRLTLLAERLIETAARLVHEDMVRSYGKPKHKDGSDAGYAVFGLGKLGGIAIGYASDIELLFVYSATGRTAGGKRKSISNEEFFITLAREASQFIRTKREGIFAVDLRLRPYGKEGPLATSERHFQEYYAPGGPAHAFERLALVRLRWIAGSAALGSTVEKLREQFVYDSEAFDLDALWEVWEKQHEQKGRSGALNAKYSPGALVDLEVSVQLLQVLNARRVPQLRTPRLSGAIEALLRGQVVTAAEYAVLLGAYRFLRRLINALRMVRGNAQDLFLPRVDTDEYTHLARRMGYEGRGGETPATLLAAEFDRRRAEMRTFIEAKFDRPCPGTGAGRGGR